MSVMHESQVAAAEGRVAAGRRLSDVERGGLVAVECHSPALAPRVAAVMATDAENAARRARRRKARGEAEHQVPTASSAQAGRAFIDEGRVL